MSESEKDDRGFKVTDRRKFTPEGNPRPVGEEVPEEQVPDVQSARQTGDEPEAVQAEPASGGPGAEDASSRPRESADTAPPDVGREVKFLDLVSMLATNALVQLGEVPDPVSGKRIENLPAVQPLIDLLGMLQEKTKGNLSKDEAEVLEQVLYDLRMHFMAKAKILKY
jgi:hypothetical protein